MLHIENLVDDEFNVMAKIFEILVHRSKSLCGENRDWSSRALAEEVDINWKLAQPL
jgi:hypothetical protein